MPFSRLSFDAQLSVFQHCPTLGIISEDTMDAQRHIQKMFPKFESEACLANYHAWHIMKECEISNDISIESKMFIYSKLLSHSHVKSFKIFNQWRADLVSQSHAHFKRLKIIYVLPLDMNSIFQHISVGELTVQGNKWHLLDHRTIQSIKQKCLSITGPKPIVSIFQHQ